MRIHVDNHLATRLLASLLPMILERGAVLTKVMGCSWKYCFNFLAAKYTL